MSGQPKCQLVIFCAVQKLLLLSKKREYIGLRFYLNANQSDEI